MAFEFRRTDRPVASGIRRIALEQIDAALAEIDDPKMPLDDKVHELRKHAKKLRGLLRLIRPGFADYAAENAALREAARALSGLRDTGVLVETHDRLIAATGAPPAPFAPLRAWLVARREAAGAMPGAGEGLAAFRAMLLALRDRAERWEIEGHGFRALAPGLAETWRRASDAMQAVEAAPTGRAIHDWRKRVKDHWYHARLLCPIRPGKMKPHASRAHDLGEMLGDHHDLTVLRQLVGETPDLPLAPAERDRFLALIARRQQALLVQALDEGHALFDRPAPALARKWQKWWKRWRAA
jgi:CHAD domain-containing protein